MQVIYTVVQKKRTPVKQYGCPLFWTTLYISPNLAGGCRYLCQACSYPLSCRASLSFAEITLPSNRGSRVWTICPSLLGCESNPWQVRHPSCCITKQCSTINETKQTSQQNEIAGNVLLRTTALRPVSKLQVVTFCHLTNWQLKVSSVQPLLCGSVSKQWIQSAIWSLKFTDKGHQQWSRYEWMNEWKCSDLKCVRKSLHWFIHSFTHSFIHTDILMIRAYMVSFHLQHG